MRTQPESRGIIGRLLKKPLLYFLLLGLGLFAVYSL